MDRISLYLNLLISIVSAMLAFAVVAVAGVTYQLSTVPGDNRIDHRKVQVQEFIFKDAPPLMD